MRTLILNGSPNGAKGNTEIFVQQFMRGCSEPCHVSYIAKEDPGALAASMADYDTVLFFMPLYVHAMPGIVMKLIEHMKRAHEGQHIGFVVQYGFVEGAQAQYVKRYFELLAKRLGYTYCGTVVHGGAAGVRYMPDKMNRDLFASLQGLGSAYNSSGQMDAQISKQLEEPYTLSSGKVALYRFLTRIGIMNMFWNKMLRSNNAYEKRFDKPFSS